MISLDAVAAMQQPLPPAADVVVDQSNYQNPQDKNLTNQRNPMGLIRFSSAIAGIRGSFGGQTFKRDSSGSHIVSKPRRVRGCSTAQARQRRAFMIARAYSSDLRTLSYNIYRVLSGLAPAEPPIDFKP